MPSVQAILPDESIVYVPAWVTDHASFLRWAASDEASERGKIGYLHRLLRQHNGTDISQSHQASCLAGYP